MFDVFVRLFRNGLMVNGKGVKPDNSTTAVLGKAVLGKMKLGK